MVSVYTNHLRLEEIGTGEQSGDWGTTTNTNLELIAEGFSYGTEAIADADITLTMADGTSDGLRSFYVKITSSVDLTATRTITLADNTISKVWLIENATSGSQIITIKQGTGSGASVNIANGQVKMIATDGGGTGGIVYDLLTDVELAGTTTATALTVDDVAIDGKVITMTGSSGDTAVMTVGTNGTLAVTTTDGSGATANITITADGTFEAAGTTVTLNSSGGITLDADGGTITFADAGSSLGTITSSGYSGTAAVATTVTITDNESTNENNAIIFTAGGDVDGGNIGLESDGTLTYNPSTGTVTATGFSGNLTGTLQTPAQTNVTSLGTLSALAVSGEITGAGFTGTLDGILGSGTAAAATVTTLDTSDAVNLNLTTDSTSSTSGALIVDGGVGIAKKLYVGTDFDVSNNAVIDGTALVTGVLTTTATQVATGGITSGSNIVSDTDGADDLGLTGTRWRHVYADAVTVTDQIIATGFTGTLDGVLGSGTAAAATVTTLNTSDVVNLNLTTESTSSTSGALIVDGGVGIAKKLFVGSDLAVAGTTNLDNTDIDGTLVVDGSNISLDSTTTLNIDNSNTSNGITIGTATSAVPISIGHGTSETTVNDNLTVTGNLTINGTTTTVATTNTTVADHLIKLGQGYTGSANDQGFIVTRGDGSSSNTANRGFIWDESADEFATIAANTEAGTTTGNVTINDYANIRVGALTADDASLFSGGIKVANDGNIGSAGDTDAIAISSSGVVTFSQAPVFPDGSINIADLDIDGGTDINEAIADADLFIVDNGAGGTNRKTTASRMKTYFQGSVNSTTGTFSGVLKTDDTTDATSTTDGSLQTDGGLSVAKDAVLGNDVKLLSDAAVLSFGANSEVTLTHVHNDGLLLNADNQLQFRDSAINIRSDADGDLDINADDEIELNSTLIDINGSVDMSSTLTVAGVVDITDTTDASDATGDTGALRTEGGASIAKKLFVGTNLSLPTDADADDNTADSATGRLEVGASGDLTLYHNTNSYIVNKTGNLIFHSETDDSDIVFTGEDDTSGITALTLDMSDAGTAIFNHDAKFADDSQVIMGAGADLILRSDGTSGVIQTNNGNLTVDGAADIILNADSGSVRLFDATAEYARLNNNSGNLIITSGTTTAATFSGANVTFAGTLASGAITSSGNVTAFSDRRLKSDIQTLENGLEKVEQLRGVTYTRDDNVDGEQQLGVIAQEVEEVFPQVVLTADDERGTKSVDYGRLTGALIEAVKELSAKVKNLEEQLDGSTK